LIEARLGVDHAYILASRLRVVGWSELRKAQRALRMSVLQKKKDEAERKKREEAEKNKPVKCPEYTYPPEPASTENKFFKAELKYSNSRNKAYVLPS